jgi:hypothetical protein
VSLAACKHVFIIALVCERSRFTRLVSQSCGFTQVVVSHSCGFHIVVGFTWFSVDRVVALRQARKQQVIKLLGVALHTCLLQTMLEERLCDSAQRSLTRMFAVHG